MFIQICLLTAIASEHDAIDLNLVSRKQRPAESWLMETVDH